MAASSVISVKVCLWTVCGCKYIANKLYRSKTILIGRTFSMFNIIKIPRKYLRELLHDSNVAFHCKKSLTAILGGKLFREVFCRPSTAPVNWIIRRNNWYINQWVNCHMSAGCCHQRLPRTLYSQRPHVAPLILCGLCKTFPAQQDNCTHTHTDAHAHTTVR